MTPGLVVRALPLEDPLLTATGIVLTTAEQRRRDRLRRRCDRATYEAAHVLVRLCAAELSGRPAHDLELRQTCPDCGGQDHGVPSFAGLPGVHVSLSHTEGFVAAVAALMPCGVDVEAIVATRVVPRALHPDERALVSDHRDPGAAFASLWTRKESLVKAGALTLDRAPGVAVHGDGPLLDRWDVQGTEVWGAGGRAWASWVWEAPGGEHHTMLGMAEC